MEGEGWRGEGWRGEGWRGSSGEKSGNGEFMELKLYLFFSHPLIKPYIAHVKGSKPYHIEGSLCEETLVCAIELQLSREIPATNVMLHTILTRVAVGGEGEC